jgi:energy-coupling factor transporter ATP-binding protein EcfA2
LIEIRRLHYSYPGAEDEALRGIDLEVPEGQFCGIVGANGAGKSTLCFSLSGFVPHFFRGRLQGVVRVAGKPVSTSTLGELAGEVGLVFQNPFNQISGARFNVVDEIAFGLENLGLHPDEIRARVNETLEQVGLTQEADRSPLALSGGQQQRVAIAAILAMRPRVLVLDEPASQLDPRGSEEVFATLKNLTQRSGTTVVLVEHKLEWLATFCDRVVALHEGKVVEDGEPRQVLNSASLERYGVGTTVYTQAARRILREGLVEKAGPAPVTLDQAVDFLR